MPLRDKTGHSNIEYAPLKTVFSISSLVAAGLWGAIVSTNAQVNVVQYHNNSTRDGLYIDSAFTQSAAANLIRDLNFDGTIVGNVLAQPLYIEGGPGGQAMVIVATTSNNVYALNAATGAVIWQRNVGAPVPIANISCTEVGSMGIIGTPVVDLVSRALFLDAMVTPDGGTTIKHYILSLNVDTGAINPGWPVDVGLAAIYNGTHFTPAIQQQRPALAIVGNILYVGYGSMGDSSLYHGWLVGVPINNPASVTAWAAGANGGAIWSTSGVASDGTNPFVGTGNTFNTGGVWSGGEAVIRFQPGPIFSGSTSDYWAPTNWPTLDAGDQDVGACRPLLVDVPGATPSSLIVVMGKDEFAHILNRSNLGGITTPVAQAQVASSYILGGPATYKTNQGTYVAFRAGSNALKTFRITATSPPTIATGWDTYPVNGCGSPFVTSTDGTNNMIVWTVGTEGDQRLRGYNGDTGAVIYPGGGANELMAGTHSYSTTGIVARGRIYIATDNKVYAFKVPGGTPTPTPTPTATATPTPTPPPPTPTPTATTTPMPSAVTADFNGDGHPDWVIRHATTGQTAIVYMNNNVVIGAAFGPPLPNGWNVVGVADFNGDGQPDYLLFNPSSGRTAIWYLSGSTLIGGAFGPTLPSGWALVATADFNGDGKPDYVIYRASSRQTAIVYMNNNVAIGAAFGPTLPPGWTLAAP